MGGGSIDDGLPLGPLPCKPRSPLPGRQKCAAKALCRNAKKEMLHRDLWRPTYGAGAIGVAAPQHLVRWGICRSCHQIRDR